MNKKLLKFILPSIAAIAMAGSIVASGTYALFTSEDKQNIAVSSGDVKLSASVSGIKLFSAYDASLPTTGKTFETVQVGEETVNYVQLDEHGFPYYSEVLAGNTFTDGGTVTYDAGLIDMKRISAGDKVTFTVNYDNTSTIDIKYRVVIECLDEDDASLKFYSRLLFSYGDQDLSKVKKFTTDWMTRTAPAGVPQAIDPEEVSIKLPLTEGNDITASSCHLRIYIEGVQANAHTEGSAQKLLIDYVEEVVTKDLDDKLEDIELEAGETVEETTSTPEVLCTVKVPLSQNTIEAEKAAGNEPVVVDDTLNLKIEQKPTIEEGSVVIPMDSKVLSFDVELTNQNGEKIVSTQENIEVQLYVGLGRSIEGVYHNGDPVDSYTYENGIVTILTKSFSEYAVTYFDPSKLPGVCYVGETYYDTVKQGAAALKDGEKLVVFKNSNEPCLNNDCIQVHAKNTEIEVLDGVTITTSAGPQSILLNGIASTSFTLSGRGKFVVSTMYSGTFINQGAGEAGASAAVWDVTLKDITVEFTDPTANNAIFGINGASSGPRATIVSGNYKNCVVGKPSSCVISGGRYSDAGCLSYMATGKAATQLDGTDGYLYKVEDFSKNNAACYIEYDTPVVAPTSIVKKSGTPVVEPIVEVVGDKTRAYWSTAVRGLNNLESNQEFNLLIDSSVDGIVIDNISNAAIKLNGHEFRDATVSDDTHVGPTAAKCAIVFEDVSGIVVDGGVTNSGMGSILSKVVNNGGVIGFKGTCDVQIKNTKLTLVGAQSPVMGFFGTAANVELVNSELFAESSSSTLFHNATSSMKVEMVSGKILSNADEAMSVISPKGGDMSIDASGNVVVKEHQPSDPYGAKIVGSDSEVRAYFSGDGASDSAIRNVQSGETVYIKENSAVARTLPLGFTITIVDESEEGAMWVSGYNPVDGAKVTIDHEAESKVYVLSVVEIKVCELTHAGVTTSYKTVQEAVTAATSNTGDVIKMIDDCVISKGFTIDKALTLDMNGHTITFTKGGFTSHTSSKQTTIKGSGMIYSKSGCPLTKGSSSGAKGQLMIYNVTLKSDTTYALDVTIGCCYVYSGTFLAKSGVNAVNPGWSVNTTYFFQIQGGTYSSDISKISKDGFSITKSVVDNGDGTWTVK